MKNYVIYITESVQINTQSHYSNPQLLKLIELDSAVSDVTQIPARRMVG